MELVSEFQILAPAAKHTEERNTVVKLLAVSIRRTGLASHWCRSEVLDDGPQTTISIFLQSAAVVVRRLWSSVVDFLF